jgi:hypothetical protein
MLVWTPSPTPAAPEIPEGFEVVQITDDPNRDTWPRLNACGEIVFTKLIEERMEMEELFLYDNGATVRLTDNEVRDALPAINEQGHVAWTTRSDDSGHGTVALYDGASTWLLWEGFAPDLNDRDQFVWLRYWDTGCWGADADVFFYDGRTVTRVTADGSSNQGTELDDKGRIVWTRYDFCPQQWTSNITRYENGQSVFLPSDRTQPQVASLNNLGQVAWGNRGIELWQDGVTRRLTPRGAVPRLNDLGDIAFVLWSEERQTWDAWLYQEGQFIELTHVEQDGPWVGAVDISNWGEVVWQTLDIVAWEGDVFYMRRIRNGESDFDGDVDLDDAASLHDCLTGPGDFDRLCDCRFLDIDHDRDVDLGDFVLFQRNYTGSK